MSPAGRKAASPASRLIRRAGPAARRALPPAVALLVVAVSLTIMAASRPASAARSGQDGWITSWSASPQAAGPRTLGARGFDNQTIREVILASAGGDPIRLELTNVFGTTPLHVGHVTVAQADAHDPGSAAVLGQVHPVTFGGSPSVVIPAGAQLLSDPVAMPVAPLENLAISVYLPDRTGPATFHSDAQQLNWLSGGDHAADQGASAFTTSTLSWYYVNSLVVRSADEAGTVVALGDSITDGVGSTTGADARWPNDLARRLDALGSPALSVADEGIGGNRLLGGSTCCGVSAPARFTRDVLDRPGVRDVIVLEGINDVGVGMAHPGIENVSTDRIIAVYREMIAQAHARGLKIFGATILPYQGAGYFTAAGETIREQVNNWILTSRAFDGVIDFNAVMSDPANPLRLNPFYDSGDHLHPNDAGYQAMADAINLQMLFPAGLTAGAATG